MIQLPSPFQVLWPTIATCLLLCTQACAPAENLHDDPAHSGHVTGPTYNLDIKKIVDQNCTSCHQTGNIGPFPLTTFEEVKAMAETSLLAMEDRRMPPWPADPDCRRYKHELLMEKQNIQTFRDWVDAGKPEGVASDLESTELALDSAYAPIVPSHVALPYEPYTPSLEYADDYRCLPLDIEFTEDMYITESEVIPGELDLVHHVLLYAVPPSRVALLEEFDAAEPGPGYTCFGGGEVATPIPIGAWVPGMPPIRIGLDAAIRVPAGARVVMQVHYNVLAVEPRPDLTTWHVTMSNEKPKYLIESRPFAHHTIYIPSGDAEVKQSKEYINNTNQIWDIVSVAPHMHLLGYRIRVDYINEQGEEECIIDIPEWDFNWQRSYAFRHGEHVQVAPGEGLRLTCYYDNSATNQPVVNGKMLDPTDVFWGDGTLDEMCLSYITVLKEFSPEKGQCEAYNECSLQHQDDTDFSRLMSCLSTDSNCALCSLQNMFKNDMCLDKSCKPEINAAEACMLGCATQIIAGGGDMNLCMEETCLELKTALDDCATPALESGKCEAEMLGCGMF
jgi:hypothetical protein